MVFSWASKATGTKKTGAYRNVKVYQNMRLSSLTNYRMNAIEMRCDPSTMRINLNRTAVRHCAKLQSLQSLVTTRKTNWGVYACRLRDKNRPVQSSYRALVMSVKRRCNARSIARARAIVR